MPHVVEVVERIIVPDLPQIDLPSEDGLPLESNWHRIQINQLVESVRQHWRGRTDFFAGGNMFVYYSMQQVRSREYKGPDVFVVKNVDGERDRRAWIVWEENSRFPNVIVELLSPSTAAEDLGSKKDLYEQTFKTPEYFCYDPATRKLQGWRLGQRQTYESLKPNKDGRLFSKQLGAWLGLWKGKYQGVRATWVRLFEKNGEMAPTGEEAERRRAEAERRRAQAAEAEAARLRKELGRLKRSTNARKQSPNGR
jgi:Uma2 family endonuclease